jgi:2-dehydro-3-deoxyphosphogluconate aldolase/(4S)-4-hydroxy-2-oxoglutarate aldolase
MSALSGCILVLRGYGPADSVTLAEAAWDSGIDLVEVSILEDSDWDSFSAIADRAGGSRRAGVGSLRSAESVHRARSDGASFALSAGFTPALAAAAQEAQLELVPGVFTPSEIIAALAAGCRTLKLFPAATVGPGYLRALKGPFPDLQMIAVGGIGPENAVDFIKAGAVGLGLGSSLLPSAPFRPGDVREAGKAMKSLVEQVERTPRDNGGTKP